MFLRALAHAGTPLQLVRPTRFSLPLLIVTTSAVTLLVWYTSSTTQQIMFILFGAPVIYAALVYGLPCGTVIAGYAAVAATAARFWSRLTT